MITVENRRYPTLRLLFTRQAKGKRKLVLRYYAYNELTLPTLMGLCTATGSHKDTSKMPAFRDRRDGLSVASECFKGARPTRWGGCITQKLGEQKRGECQAAWCKLKSVPQQSSAAKAAYRLWRVSARQRSMALVLAIV